MEEVLIHSFDGRRVEHDLVGNPEVPAIEVDPTTLGFSPEDGSWRPLHDLGSVRSDSEVSSTLLDGLQDDLGMASTQLSPTLLTTQRDVAEVHSQPVLTQLRSTVPTSRGSLRRVGREVPTVDLTANDNDQSNEEPLVALPRRRRLRLLGTQPTVPDPPTNKFSPLEEVDSQVGIRDRRVRHRESG